jgi:ABC-type transport system involved in multi-copper enzyme maturation permease subunit
MRLLRVFIEYEARTQFRSARFRGLAIVYVLAASAPAVVTYVVSGRSSMVIGSAAYNAFILSVQPLLTVLLAAGLSVDAVARERDEGSFAILSVAPISSAGYLLRRLIAVVILCLPLTLLPPAIAAALAGYAQHRMPLLSAFAGGWLFYVLPPLLIGSALFIALGTITGRTVLSIIFVALLVTIGFDVINDLAFLLHRNFSPPSELFHAMNSMQQLIWTIRGYWSPRVPSDAAFPLMSEARMFLPRAGITTAVAIVLLGLSAFYLRRTRRDLRPWQISETNPVRTLLRTVNRIREEYVPDAGSDAFDRAALAVSLVFAMLFIEYLVHTQSLFANRAAERYAAEIATAAPTNTAIIPQSMRIEAEVGRTGEVRSRAILTLHNSGSRPESHLSFDLNPGLKVQRIAISSGRQHSRRVWERLDVDLDPPLAAGESRSLSFDMAGLPGDIDFNLQYPGDFRQRWNRYRTAKQSIYMTDLSLSRIDAAATEVRMAFGTNELAPVVRYTPWTLRTEGRQEGFIPEAIAPPAMLDVQLHHPYSIVADSCGALAARKPLISRCTTGLASYVIFGGPFAESALTPAATLAYIPVHVPLARTHTPSLASSIALAAESWRGLTLPPHLVFVERPAEGNGRVWFYEGDPWFATQFIGSSGALFFVPEELFMRLKPIDSGIFAAAIMSSSLRAKRHVVPEEAAFFNRFFMTVAIGRLGGHRTNAVEAGVGFPPDTSPLIESSMYYRGGPRMAKVLSAIEYRAGVDHFVDGVNDFLAGGPQPGTAKELVEAIGRRGGFDLSHAYQDYFLGRALPKLSLTDVSFRAVGTRWEVHGNVLNEGTGEAFVPLVLRTSQGSQWKTLRVDTGERVPFAFDTDAEPRSLQLDPDRVCYRQAAVGTVDTIDYRGRS